MGFFLRRSTNLVFIKLNILGDKLRKRLFKLAIVNELRSEDLMNSGKYQGTCLNTSTRSLDCDINYGLTRVNHCMKAGSTILDQQIPSQGEHKFEAQYKKVAAVVRTLNSSTSGIHKYNARTVCTPDHARNILVDNYKEGKRGNPVTSKINSLVAWKQSALWSKTRKSLWYNLVQLTNKGGTPVRQYSNGGKISEEAKDLSNHKYSETTHDINAYVSPTSEVLIGTQLSKSKTENPKNQDLDTKQGSSKISIK